MNSDGSAERENEKYLESVRGHLDQLQARWQSFSADLANADLLKNIIDGLSGLVTLLNTAVDAFGSLGTVAIPILATMSKKGNIGKKNMPSYVVTCRMSVA